MTHFLVLPVALAFGVLAWLLLMFSDWLFSDKQQTRK
jgi:hypothetical protein